VDALQSKVTLVTPITQFRSRHAALSKRVIVPETALR